MTPPGLDFGAKSGLKEINAVHTKPQRRSRCLLFQDKQERSDSDILHPLPSSFTGRTSVLASVSSFCSISLSTLAALCAAPCLLRRPKLCNVSRFPLIPAECGRATAVTLTTKDENVGLCETETTPELSSELGSSGHRPDSQWRGSAAACVVSLESRQTFAVRMLLPRLAVTGVLQDLSLSLQVP